MTNTETQLSGSDIKTQVEGIVDDSIDTTVFLTLANTAKDEIEGMLKIPGLIKNDVSQSANPGDTFSTFKNLPADFVEMAAPYIIYVGVTPYRQISIEALPMYENSAQVYYVDYANSRYALCGSVSSSQVITFPYISASSEWISTNLSSVFPSWRSKFHNYCVHRIAELYQGGYQADDISARQSGVWGRVASGIKDEIVRWVANVTVGAMGGSSAPLQTPYDLDSPYPKDPNLGSY